MRKTEMWFGLFAGVAGLAIALLSYASLLSYSPDTAHNVQENVVQTYSIVCMAANILGISGALLVQKSNIPGALLMALAMIAVMVFGFPWQSLPAVFYIISVVMATVPVKTAAQD